MTDTNTVHWKRISIEALAIVASILLAFAIDAWWANVQERGFEHEILLSLQEEFQDHRDELEQQRITHTSLLGAVLSLISFANTGVYDDSQFSIDRQMFLLRVPVTTDFGSGVRDALISSGRIEVISNKPLRFEIAEWASVLDELKDDQQHGVKIVFDMVLPYLIREGVPTASLVRGLNGSELISYSRILADQPDVVERLFTDPEFLTILEVRYGFLNHALGEYDSLIEATDSILVKLGIELR